MALTHRRAGSPRHCPFAGHIMMTLAQWQHWEIRRYLDAGRFGYFTKEDAK